MVPRGEEEFVSVLTVRDMTEHDVRGVSTIRITGWRSAYAEILPQSYLEGLSIEADAEWRKNSFRSDPRVQNVVAEDRNGLVGWGVFGPSRDDDRAEASGELYALYVAPDRIGTGVGRALMEDLLSRARTAAFTSLTLWVVADNHRARRFYERAGFHFDGSCSDWAVGGTTVAEMRYARDIDLPH